MSAHKQSSKTFPLGRDAKNGQFITVDEAEKRRATATVERIPKSGRGDTEKSGGSSKRK